MRISYLKRIKKNIFKKMFQIGWQGEEVLVVGRRSDTVTEISADLPARNTGLRLQDRIAALPALLETSVLVQRCRRRWSGGRFQGVFRTGSATSQTACLISSSSSSPQQQKSPTISPIYTISVIKLQKKIKKKYIESR